MSEAAPATQVLDTITLTGEAAAAPAAPAKTEEKKGPRPPAAAPPSSGIPASVPLPDDWKYHEDEKRAVTHLTSASTHLPSDNWVFNHDMDNDIKVYTRDNPDGSARAVCGVGVIKAPPMKVVTEAGNTDNWKAWDPLLKGFEYIQLTPIHRVYHLTFNSYWPYGERDIVYLETKKELPDGSLVLATTAIDHPKFPVTPAYVRANLKAGGWHVRPFPGNPAISTVTYYMNTDPLLAFVPTVLLNLASTRFPAIIEKLRINCGVPTVKK